MDKGESTIQPCVDGELKKLLLLIKNTEDRSRWLNQLSRITRGIPRGHPAHCELISAQHTILLVFNVEVVMVRSN